MHLAKNKTATGPMLVSQRVTPRSPAAWGRELQMKEDLGTKTRLPLRKAFFTKHFQHISCVHGEEPAQARHENVSDTNSRRQ